MKKPLSVIVMLFGLVVLTVIWPMKAKFVSIPRTLILGVVILILSLLLHGVLNSFKDKIVFYSQSASDQTSAFISIGYLGVVSGVYLGYNYSVVHSFLDVEFSAKFRNLYVISILGSILSYLILTALENLKFFRAKYSMLYGNEWDMQEMYLTALSNVAISEFAGIVVGFYAVVFLALYELAEYLLGDLPREAIIGVAAFLLLGVLGGIIGFRIYKKKIKF